MELTCSDCKKSFTIPDHRLPKTDTALILPCPACKGRIRIMPRGGPADPAPNPVDDPGSPPASVPLAGGALQEKIVASVKRLPPMPQVAQKARQLISDPKASFKDIARIIETDQAIAAQLLKISNSSYYGVSGNISSVQHAAAILGTKTLMEILNMACAAGFLQTRLAGYDQEAEDLWTHSLAVATASKMIALRRLPDMADDAFSAGLIHDVGKLILDPYVLERKAHFDDFVASGQASFLDAEREIFGFDHAEIAARICEKWQMPAHLHQAIRNHHNPLAVKDDPLTQVVHTADVIAIMSGMGVGLDGMLYVMDEKAMTFLNLSETDVYDLLGEVIEAVQQTLAGT